MKLKPQQKTWIILLLPLFYFLVYLPLHTTIFVEVITAIGGVILLGLAIYFWSKKMFKPKKVIPLYIGILLFLIADMVSVIIAVNALGYSRDVNILMSLLGEFAWWKMAIGYLVSASLLFLLVNTTYALLEKEHYYLWSIIAIFWSFSIIRLILYTNGIWSWTMFPVM